MAYKLKETKRATNLTYCFFLKIVNSVETFMRESSSMVEGTLSQ